MVLSEYNSARKRLMRDLGIIWRRSSSLAPKERSLITKEINKAAENLKPLPASLRKVEIKFSVWISIALDLVLQGFVLVGVMSAWILIYDQITDAHLFVDGQIRYVILMKAFLAVSWVLSTLKAGLCLVMAWTEEEEDEMFNEKIGGLLGWANDEEN